MDLYCQVCAEPWDIFSLEDMTPVEREQFKAGKGCPGCKGIKPKGMGERDKRICEIAGALASVLGDDLDGLACEMEDAEMMGYFDRD